MPDKPHILFICGREPQYTRNDVILRSLRPRYRLTEISSCRLGSLTVRILGLIPRFVRALRQPHDVVFVGFYGHPLVWLARRLSDCPIVFDAFLLTHDTLVSDRQRFRADSFVARLAHSVDRVAGQTADQVLFDTSIQADFFAGTYGVPRERVRAVFVGCNEDIFHPAVLPDRPTDGRFHVLYYGTYQPLHGMDTVVAAARLLADDDNVCLRIIGEGQEYARTRQFAAEWRLNNVEFQAPVPYESLPAAIASADLCLGGPFGRTSKAQRVITGKTFQFLAMAKPVVVSDTPANRELLTPGETAVFVPLADPAALADAIRSLQDDHDLRSRIATAGYACYRTRASESVIGRQLAAIIEEVLGERLSCQP
jgi:glycosyltransferase involved in cell wall biosynthesis